jgi:hypothetical protein
MEQFILLFRGSDVYQKDQSPEALQQLTVKMIDWVTKLVKNGLHVSSEKFQQSGKQVNGTKHTVTDKPFGEAKDVIGGCTIVRARNIGEAVEIARSCPILETNANIEIRLIQTV